MLEDFTENVQQECTNDVSVDEVVKKSVSDVDNQSVSDVVNQYVSDVVCLSSDFKGGGDSDKSTSESSSQMYRYSEA